MKRVLVALAFLGLVFGTSAYASNEGPGCGLGTQLFKGQSGVLPMTLAATTNGISGNQTFGMTSGTSGCKADSVIMNDKAQEAFVATNLSTLNQEMAQGQGEHVMALASLMGCPTAAQSEFARVSQESYGSVFATTDAQPNVVLATLKEEIGRHPTLAASCSSLS
jgi:Protein of unknown function (DUF3015)